MRFVALPWPVSLVLAATAFAWAAIGHSPGFVFAGGLILFWGALDVANMALDRGGKWLRKRWKRRRERADSNEDE